MLFPLGRGDCDLEMKYKSMCVKINFNEKIQLNKYLIPFLSVRCKSRTD